ncbi:GmrSD restriction endonuclease domain-containing protein [Rhizobium sp. CAU 1783]
MDQNEAGRLDLDPPYQRRSVWTPKDRRYFLDTLFRGYPCPPVYLHKTIDQYGSAMFHVVDGKQRIETIIKFADNRLRIPEDYGDERLNNKRWKDIVSDTQMRNAFLNYPFVVEYFDDVESSIVNEIFERMNKNSRKLTQQELRNARYDGWFSREVDREVNEGIWRKLGISTTGRARRMADVQFVAELLMLIIDEKIVGFEHAAIDNVYADYDDLAERDESEAPFDEEKFRTILSSARDFLTKMYDHEPRIADYLSSVSNMYVLWAVLVLDKPLSADDTAQKYLQLMETVALIAREKKFIDHEIPDAQELQAEDSSDNEVQVTQGEPTLYNAALEYFDANQSATTEFPQRAKRLSALRRALQT